MQGFIRFVAYGSGNDLRIVRLIVRVLQEARPLLLKAHECLMRETDLLDVMSKLRSDFDSSRGCGDSVLPGVPEQSFVELGRVWQAPLYEITLNFDQHEKPNGDGGQFHYQECSYKYEICREMRIELFI